tara:strand:- start:650 stop:868 length:219 start_codon:yes stop_codon:yes gene_type:complete
MSTKIDDTLHLKNFIESINKADNARQRELKVSIDQAKRVRNALTTILIHYAEIQSRKSQDVVDNKELDGGKF